MNDITACEFCELKFYSTEGSNEYLQVGKYNHLIGHGEFFVKIRTELERFPNIPKYFKFKNKKALNNQRNTYQFYGVIYNNDHLQHFSQLSNLNQWFGLYGQEIESKYPGMINRKISTDFFSFYSELEVFNSLKQSNLNPEIQEGNNNPDVDFVVPSASLSFEVKTPLQKKDNLGFFVTSSEIQKQIQERKKHHPAEKLVLIVDTKYVYPEFPIKLGDWVRRGLISSYSGVSWDCCITYNTLHKKSDIQINPNASLSDSYAQILVKIKKALINGGCTPP